MLRLDNGVARLTAVLVGAGVACLVAQLFNLIFTKVSPTIDSREFLLLFVVLPLVSGGIGGATARLEGRLFAGFDRLILVVGVVLGLLVAVFVLSAGPMGALALLAAGVLFGPPVLGVLVIGFASANLVIRRR